MEIVIMITIKTIMQHMTNYYKVERFTHIVIMSSEQMRRLREDELVRPAEGRQERVQGVAPQPEDLYDFICVLRLYMSVCSYFLNFCLSVCPSVEDPATNILICRN